MKAFWRGSADALRSHADWRERLNPKNCQPGTSAPTLAAAWAGPVEVFGALEHASSLAGLVIEEAVVEAQAKVDDHPGGRRNHDLVLRGRLPNGDRAVVCVEAKAGEPLGLPVIGQRAAARAAKKKNPASNAEDRVEALIKRFVPSWHPAERVDDLRYQLLTALAGTISEAQAAGASHAVLMVHDFRTDQRPDDAAREHDRDLHAFCTALFDLEPPGSGREPWCIHLGTVEDAHEVELYLARAVTDLRADALKQH